jgi:hypothetical protein
MLNTKPIKKNNQNSLNNGDFNDNNLQNKNDDEILNNIGINTDKIDGNIKNFKINNILNDTKNIDNIQQPQYINNEIKHVPISVPFIVDNQNDNLNNIQQNNQQKNNHIQQNNNLNNNQQNILMCQTQINTYATFNEDTNSYVIYINDKIQTIFTNKDIISSLTSNTNQNETIKNYLYIINSNIATGLNEIIFINSVITNNITIMIKIQNFIYDLLCNYEINDNTYDIVLFFYHQLIIYLFKNYSKYENHNKIQQFYSTLSYRFSSLILKQLVNIENQNNVINSKIKHINNIKNSLKNNLSSVDSDLTNNSDNSNNSDYLTSYISDDSNNLSNNSVNSSNNSVNSSDNSVNSSDNTTIYSSNSNNKNNTPDNSTIYSSEEDLTSFIDNAKTSKQTNEQINEFTSSQKLIDKHNIKKSNGDVIKNVNDIFQNKNDGIEEIKKDNMVNQNILNTDTENNVQMSSVKGGKNKLSYNKMSAKNNAKHYHIKLKK